MIISYITLLPIDKKQADAVVIGITIKPIPEGDKVIELDVVAIFTKVSIDFNLVVSVFGFLNLFGCIVFIFEICNHFFIVVDMVVKTVKII